MNTYDFSPMLRYTVGFDRMQRLMETVPSERQISYPPYNIETDNDNSYRISIAAAGFEISEIKIMVEGEKLTVVGTKSQEKEFENYVHRGIAERNFQLSFNLADYIKVDSAAFKDGMLIIDLKREIPEALKAKEIKIKAHSSNFLKKGAKKMINADKMAA